MVKMYTIPNCPMCEELKNYMKSSHIDYTETNVEEDFMARAKMVSLDIEQMPAIEMNGKIYAKDVEELKSIVTM